MEIVAVEKILTGKTALVTGAGGRLGHVIVAVLSREGAKVGSLDADRVLAERGAACAESGYPVVADVRDSRAIARAVDLVEEQLGPVSVVVNAHGVYPNTAVLDMDDSEWDETFAINARGTMAVCREICRRWVARGTPGSIVNLSSGAASSVRPGNGHYSGSKAAVNALTKVLALELGEQGIRVNAIEPGMVLDDVYFSKTGAAAYRPESARPYVEAMVASIPLGRTGRPEDIAEAVAFLASERSSWITGTILRVDGGSEAGRSHLPHSPGIR